MLYHKGNEMDDKSKQENLSRSREKTSWFRSLVMRGADIKINPDQKDLKGSVQESFSINPFYLPKVKFWNAPDVQTIWRGLCRSILPYLVNREAQEEDFEEICKLRGITEKQLSDIMRYLKLTARIALFTGLASLVLAAYYWSLPAWLMGLGSAFFWGAIWWKYSFRLWQVRLRSLDKEKASVRAFMQGDWYIEAIK